MKFRDAREQIEREQPDLKGTPKLEAIKELRDIAKGKPIGKIATQVSTNIRHAWLVFAVVLVGGRLLGFAIWRHWWVPGWYGWTHVALCAIALIEVVMTYRARKRQRPV